MDAELTIGRGTGDRLAVHLSGKRPLVGPRHVIPGFATGGWGCCPEARSTTWRRCDDWKLPVGWTLVRRLDAEPTFGRRTGHRVLCRQMDVESAIGRRTSVRLAVRLSGKRPLVGTGEPGNQGTREPGNPTENGEPRSPGAREPAPRNPAEPRPSTPAPGRCSAAQLVRAMSTSMRSPASFTRRSISLSSRSTQRTSGSPTGTKFSCRSHTISVRSAPSTYCCHQICRR